MLNIHFCVKNYTLCFNSNSVNDEYFCEMREQQKKRKYGSLSQEVFKILNRLENADMFCISNRLSVTFKMMMMY